MRSATDVRLTSCGPKNGQSGPPWVSGFETPELHWRFGLRRARQLFGAPPASDLATLPVRERLNRAWFGGVLFPYYGHFIVESLGMLPNIPDDGLPIVFMALQNTVTNWHRRFFEDAGLARRLRITDAHSAIHISELLKADQSTVFQAEVSSAYIDWTHGLFPSVPRSGRLLYLSRRECRNARVLGEDRLEARLAEIGVESVVPEKLTIREQAHLLDACDVVVAVEGSALHTLAFCPSPKKIIVLHRRHEMEHAFRLQFAMQPQFRVTEMRCMKHYAATFMDSAEVDVDRAVEEIRSSIYIA